MGLFGSSDDSEDDESGAEAAAGGSADGRGGTGADGSAGDRIAGRVDSMVDDVRDLEGPDQTDRLREMVDRLDEPGRERLASVRALARVACDDPDTLDPVVDRIVDRLADREYARPIAEGVLGSAYRLRSDGVDPGVVAAATLDALGEAMGRFDSVRTGTGTETVAGGGAAEVALGVELRAYADSVGGREQLAVEGGADALEAVPRTLARRAGLDPLDTIVDMRSRWDFDAELVGVDVERGELRDATEPAMHAQESAVRARITDGIALGTIVACTHGTVTQLEALTGHDPHPK